MKGFPGFCSGWMKIWRKGSRSLEGDFYLYTLDGSGLKSFASPSGVVSFLHENRPRFADR